VLWINLVGTFSVIRLAATRLAARLGRPSKSAALEASIVENGKLNGGTIRLADVLRMAPR
jgi:hypothetical protein